MKKLRYLLILLALSVIAVSCDRKETTEPHLQCSAPIITPNGGTYLNNTVVNIYGMTDGAVVRYTTDGSVPNGSSSIVIAPFQITVTTSIKAIAMKEGYLDSEISEATFTITRADTVATPVFDPPGGAYGLPISVAITCPTEGAEIYYRRGGSYILYTGPVLITNPSTLTAKAAKSGMVNSSEHSEAYTSSYEPTEMVQIGGGTFYMGRTTGDGSPDELPVHQVYVTGFSISKYEITQREWEDVMGENPSSFTGDASLPVENVSIYSIMSYCNRRSIREGKAPVYSINFLTNPDYWGEIPTSDNPAWNNIHWNWDSNGYRLPTEAEWEFAARARTNNPDYIYAGSNDLDEVAWHYGNSGAQTHNVGLKQPNGWGMYDMSGNVWEWCWDWFGPYFSQSEVNPRGPATGTYRILRGGSWSMDDDDGCRVAGRGWSNPSNADNKCGFRVVLPYFH